ncbi:MAG: PAS domain S-box protein [Fuerstiella sp.]
MRLPDFNRNSAAEGITADWFFNQQNVFWEWPSCHNCVAAVYSQSLENCANIGVFALCCLLSVWVKGHCFDAPDQANGSQPSGSLPNINQATSHSGSCLLWVQAAILLFGVAHLLTLSFLPDSFRLASTICLLAAVATGLAGLLKFRRSLQNVEHPNVGSPLQQRSDQLVAKQHRLESVERNLALVLNAGQVGLWEWHPQSETFSISSSFRQLLNLPDGAVWETLEDWQDLFVGEDRLTAKKDFLQFIEGEGLGFESTYRMSTADHQTALIHYRSELIRDQHGAVIGAHGIARDVTEKLQNGHLLSLYRQAISMSQEAVLFLQSDGKIQQANHAAAKMLQQTEEQLCGLSVLDIDPSQSAGDWQTHWESLKTVSPFRAATTFHRQDGRPLHCDVQHKIVTAFGQQTLVLSGIDTSDRKRREEEQRRHEFATDRATESVYWVREDGRLFYVNKAVCRQMGYSKSELLDLRVSDLEPTLTPQVWAKRWQQVKQNRFLTTESVQQDKTGKSIHFSTNLYFYEVDGQQFVVATGRDITAETLAAVALSAKSNEMEELLRSLPLAMVFVNRERKILRVNAEACRMFGYESSELEGQSAKILYANVDDFNQSAGYQAILREDPEPRRFLLNYQRKHGDMLRAETVGVVLRGSDGEVTGYLALIKDYTEQWEAERALRRTQSALDTAADAVLWVNQKGQLIYANQVACQRLQYTKEELEQLTVADINPDIDSVKEFKESFWPRIKQEQNMAFELRHQRKDGTIFPVEIVTYFQNFEGNEFTCSSIRDITDRVESQRQLKEAQAKLELAVQSGNVSLWEWDWETGQVQISKHFHEGLGEVPGTLKTVDQWRLRLHPDDAEDESKILDRLRQSQDVDYDRTYRIRHRDGSYRWVLSRGRLLRHPDGSPHRLVGSHIDITDLREAQLRTEAYVKLVGTTDGSWDWNVETDAVIYSPRFFDLIGFSKAQSDEIAGTIGFLKERIHANDRDLFWQKIDSHFSSRKFFDHEVRLEMQDEKFRWFRFRAQTIFDSENRPVRMAGSIYDVTHQKEVEIQLRRSNSDLEQFAYVASHDLQEPLRAVSGFCSLLKLKYDEVLDADGKEFIQHAVDGTARMNGLIEDLLNYARIGRAGETKERVNLKSCVDDAVANLQTTIHEAQAEIEIDDLPDLECYPGLISRLIQNLLSNAIKFARDKVPAKITFRMGEIEDAAFGNLHLHVIDNGIGIEPKHHERVFHLFSRLHHRDNISGTGLGLAICQRILERHGGAIRVISNTDGHGSTFVISLPKKLKN